MSDRCDLSIILPAYHEAETLRSLLPRIRDNADCLTPYYEILVVDAIDAVDSTPTVCQECGVRYLVRAGSNSYGDALRTGIRESQGEYIVIMDADGSHSPDDISRMWRLKEDYDVIIGSRYTAGGKTEVHAGLTLQSYLLNATYRITLGLKIRDLSNSFRLYRGCRLRDLELVSTNFEILEEILVRLAYGPTRARITEIPIHFQIRKAGKSKRNFFAFLITYLQSIRHLRAFRAAELTRARSVKLRQ